MSLLYRTIQSHIKEFESVLYTTVPAVIEKYDPTECTVDVQPSIDEVDFDGVIRVLPVQYRVPLKLPSSFNSALTFPVKVGDKVLLHICQSNIEDYLEQPTEGAPKSITPTTKRKHDIDDCFATLGVRFYDDSPVKRPDTLDLYFGESRLTMQEDGSIDIRHTKEDVDSYVQVLPNGEVNVNNTKEGSSITLDAQGDISVVTKSKYSVENSSVELVALLSDLINTLANTTVNTAYGLSPLNSKPQLQNLKSQLDTLKR